MRIRERSLKIQPANATNSIRQVVMSKLRNGPNDIDVDYLKLRNFSRTIFKYFSKVRKSPCVTARYFSKLKNELCSDL